VAHKMDKAPFLPRDFDSLQLELNRLFIQIAQILNDMHMDGFVDWAPGVVGTAPSESPVFQVPDLRAGDFLMVGPPYTLPQDFLAQAQFVANDQAKIVVYNWTGAVAPGLPTGNWTVRAMRRHVE